MTPPPITQANRPLRVTLPLGDDVLIPVAMTGEEELSRPFLFTIDFVSRDKDVEVLAVIGKPMTLHLRVTDTTERLVHGFVRRFVNLGSDHALTRYRAEVVPEAWFLNLSASTRTFEQKSVLDILEKVCKGADVFAVKRAVATPPAPLPYVVQYRESHFGFVSRLLEDAGLYYRFEHEADRDTLVVSDALGSMIPAGQLATVPVNPQTSAAQPPPNVVTRVSRDFGVHPAIITMLDHDLLRADDFGSAVSREPGARGQWSDFLGDLGPQRSTAEAKRQAEMFEATSETVRGASTCASLQAGTRVRITGGAFGAGGEEVHLLRVTHTLTIGDVQAGTQIESKYSNEFVAIPANKPFRPTATTRRPSVRGTHAATVVGDANQGDIDVDADGRVLLEFPWDGSGDGSGGRSQHRVHVASAWAGAGWGFIQHPRLGQEVLVEYLEGDPARPIVTGRVYNANNKAPYALPADKTQSGMKSRSSPNGGTSNFNELRFEDKKGHEEVFMQAERNLRTKVKVSESRTVGASQSISVGGDRTVSVGGNENGTVKKDRTWLVVGNDQTTVAGMHMLDVTESSIETITGGKFFGVTQVYTIGVGGAYTAAVTGAMTEQCEDNRTIGVKEKFDLKAKHVLEAGSEDVEIASGAAKIKLSKDGTIEISGTHITIKSGAGQIEIDPAGIISIKGPMVKINT
jgi:type VI secretion system secreted protein VgrG